MAYTSCAAKIAASIQQDCNKPLVGGYTGRAVILSVLDFERAEIVRSATNPREILSIVLPPDGSVMAYTIDNVFAAPFTGSTTAGNNENGRNGYLKTLSVRVPMRGADVSRDVIEPLVKDPNGFVVIAEKRDKVGDGSYEVIGYQNALRGDIAGVTRDESANGGDWIVPLTTIEKWAEVTLVGAGETYESAKKEFEGLFGFEFVAMYMTSSVENQQFYEFSANGIVYIDSIKNGEKVRKMLVSPSDELVTIENDADTEIAVYGKVTRLNVTDDANTGLTSLDTSKNTALTYLSCNSNTGLTSLDVSKNLALTYLFCVNTGLTSLDVSKNLALTELSCDNTGLTSLDVSKNTALTYLSCGNTGLTSLDVSKNTALTYLSCGNTGLTSLDVSKNTALTYLDCSDCTGLTSLDVSKNTALTYLDCSDCTGVTSLDVSKNTALTYLSCGNTGLMLLDIQNTSRLVSGNLFENISTYLTTLQVAGTSRWSYEQVENWLNGDAPNDGMLYVDENTPQGVITAAEAKNWEVIYQP